MRKRLFSVLLSLVMALTFFSATVFAAELAAVEKVQALIDALPEADAVTAENRTETEAQLTAIDTAKAALTDEERDALDFTKYQVVIAALDALDGMPGASIPTVLDDTSDLQGKLDSGGTVTLDKDYTITKKLTITDSITVTLDLNGHVLKMTGDDSVICINNGGSLTLKDSDPSASHSGDYAELPAGGVITGGKGRKDVTQMRYGGGVLNYGTFIMEGGTISGCSADNGGGVCNHGYGVEANFTMKGGTISGCSADNGSGVYNDAQKDGGKATFTMENGKITGNSASSSGGGVHTSATKGCPAEFIMKGGEITGNSAGFRAGGVFKANLTSFVISGNAIVTDNSQGGTASNLYMLPGGTIVIETGSSFTGKIGVRMDNYNSDAVIISGGGTNSGSITSDDADHRIVTENGSIKLVSKQAQTINANNIEAVYGDADKNIGATSSGGGRLSYAVVSGTDVVQVDANGNLTFKKDGTAEIKITADATDECLSAEVTIKVTVVKKEQTISASNIEAVYGDENKSIGAASSGGGRLSYVVVSGTDVVQVDANGNLTFKKAGTAEIKIIADATKEYESAEVTIKVTVVKKAQEPKQDPAQTTEQTPEQTTEQNPGQNPAQTTEQNPEQNPVQTTEQNPAQTTKQTTAQTTKQNPAQTTKQNPAQTTEQNPAQTTEQTTEQNPTQTTEQNPTESGGFAPIVIWKTVILVSGILLLGILVHVYRKR